LADRVANDGNGNRPTGRARPRRAAIVTAAAELFDERGYHQTSMEDIAAAAGIRKASVYHYFRGKEELLFWLHEEFVERLMERQEARRTVPMTMSQRLLEVMADILELMETHRGHVRVFFEHHRELADPDREEILGKRDAYFEMVEDMIRGAVESGEFRPVDARFATLALFGMCNWAYQWYRPEGPLRTREIAYDFHELFLNGVGAARTAAAAQPVATTREG
jgi:AcrR family transcriptional regulator